MFKASNICFAHVAYQMQARYALRGAGIASTEARSLDAMKAALATADVLVVSGLWRNEMLDAAPSTHPSMACGPPAAITISGMVMNGPTPIISIMLSAVAERSERPRISPGWRVADIDVCLG